jgi:hypothetical protein
VAFFCPKVPYFLADKWLGRMPLLRGAPDDTIAKRPT